MLYNKLGQTDIDVSVLALGCWPFAGGTTWGDQSDEDSIATVHAALDVGITFFDTAPGYGEGHSERVLSRGLEGSRQEVVIATKVSPQNLGAADVSKSCEQSLRDLDTDYIDLLQVHWPNHEVPLAETVSALERLKDEGKVRAIGVCNFGVLDLGDLLEIGHIETDQLPYSLLWRPIEYEVLPKCVENEVGVICYSPLSQGLLTGGYASADEYPSGLARSRHFSAERPESKHGEPGCEDELFAAIHRMREVADGLGQPLADVALAWARQQAGVTSLLVGARTPEEVRLNVNSLNVDLDDTTQQELAEITDEVKEHLGSNFDMWESPGRMR